MFEIKNRDVMGRIGTVEIRKKRIETPAVLPVVNPRLQEIKPREIRKMGFPGVMANSYIIYRDKTLHASAIRRGIHKMLGFDGIVMTDSGSYQLYRYGSVKVEPAEIVEFQNSIGSDIGVILDIPTPPDADYDRAEKDLNETIRRAKESLKLGSTALVGTVQGSTHLELRKKGAKEMGKLDFDIYAIGGVVPLMEDYRLAELLGTTLRVKKFLPLDKPVHLFGCGHPMIFAIAVAAGCDLFDSAAYSLYARDGRYITAQGTLKLENMKELPCACDVCTGYTPREILELDEEQRVKEIAMHNLHATVEELKKVKQCIYDGSLWELVETRARSHPALLAALAKMVEDRFIDRFDPVTKKSAFFYSGRESLKRPEVVRHIKRLEETDVRGKTLVLLPETTKPYSDVYRVGSDGDYHICIVSPVFGVIPLEIEEIYPLGQHEHSGNVSKDQENFMRSTVKSYSKKFKNILIHESLKWLRIDGQYFTELQSLGKACMDVKIWAMMDYQFGRGAGGVFDKIKVEFGKTGRTRRIYSKDELVMTLRASDGRLIPTREGGRNLLELPYPRNRAVVSEDAESFVRDGKSVFAKFVSDCDRSIIPHQEVIVVNEKDELLATGTAILNGEEMLAFKYGVAVKIRH